MENFLKVLINFDEKIIKNQLTKYFYYTWKKKLPSIIRNFIFLILIFFIIDTLKVKVLRLDFLKFISSYAALFFFLYFVYFFINKSEYNKKVRNYISEAKNYNPTTELYFDENSFYIKSEMYDIRSLWKNVSYEVSKETIYITIQIGSPFTFI
ncbi:MAG TPA: hypothetical protein VF455_08790, partial [Chryseobacterium sp.]